METPSRCPAGKGIEAELLPSDDGVRWGSAASLYFSPLPREWEGCISRTWCY